MVVVSLTTLVIFTLNTVVSSESIAERFMRVFIRDERHHSCTEKLLCLIGADRFHLPGDTAAVEGISALADGDDTGHHRDLSRRLRTAFLRGRSDGVCPEDQYAGCRLRDSDLLATIGHLELEEQQLVERTGRQISRPFRGKRKKFWPYAPLRIPTMKEIMSHPIRTPPEAEYRQECIACEAKRSLCTMYGIGTYGLCTAVWWFGGQLGNVACNIVTLPRSLDCYQNSFENCFLKDCGVFDLDFLQ